MSQKGSLNKNESDISWRRAFSGFCPLDLQSGYLIENDIVGMRYLKGEIPDKDFSNKRFQKDLYKPVTDKNCLMDGLLNKLLHHFVIYVSCSSVKNSMDTSRNSML